MLETDDTGVQGNEAVDATPTAPLKRLEDPKEPDQPGDHIGPISSTEGEATATDINQNKAPSSRTLGMFAKAQMRNLGEFSHYFSHAN